MHDCGVLARVRGPARTCPRIVAGLTLPGCRLGRKLCGGALAATCLPSAIPCPAWTVTKDSAHQEHCLDELKTLHVWAAVMGRKKLEKPVLAWVLFRLGLLCGMVVQMHAMCSGTRGQHLGRLQGEGSSGAFRHSPFLQMDPLCLLSWPPLWRQPGPQASRGSRCHSSGEQVPSHAASAPAHAQMTRLIPCTMLRHSRMTPALHSG